MSEVSKLFGDTGDKLARPEAQRDRYGVLRRDPRGEYDWFYLLETALQRKVRAAMAPLGSGLAPDDAAMVMGYEYVDDAMAAFVQAVRVDADRFDASDEFAGYEAELEWEAADAALFGPKELADATGRSVGSIHQMRRRGQLPEADWVISGVPIWEGQTLRHAGLLEAS